jgi:tRNA A-37 threonylcarbamoyl transferase component Bud32
MNTALPSSGFEIERSPDSLTLVDEAFAADLRDLGAFAPDGIERVLSRGNPIAGGRGVAVVVTPARGVDAIVVREARHGGVLGPLLGRAYLGPKRVLDELQTTRQLLGRGASSPRPVLVLARRSWGPLWRCAIGTARLPGVNLADALAAAAERGARGDVLRAAAIAVRKLHDCGCRHADLSAGNVLIATRDGHVSAAIVDFDGAHVRLAVPARRRAREIARLWRSLTKRGAATVLAADERDLFVSAYCARDFALERSLRRWLRRERLRTALHALHYARR